jgi:hypothetical protein
MVHLGPAFYRTKLDDVLVNLFFLPVYVASSIAFLCLLCIPYPITVQPTWDDTFASACLCLSGRSSERVKRSGYIAYSFFFTSPVDAYLSVLFIKLCSYLVFSLGSDRRRTDEGAT